MERNFWRRLLRRSRGRLKRKFLAQPVWPGKLTKESGTTACKMTPACQIMSLGMALPRGDTT
jgi:hypothetical protein